MKSKISIVTLGVDDFPKMFAFYKDLGFEPVEYKEGQDYVMFQTEWSRLALFPKAKLAEDVGISGEGSGFSGVTLAHNVESKEKVDEVFAFVLSKGAKKIKEPEEAFWGGYSGYFADPEDNLWEVAFNPFDDLF